MESNAYEETEWYEIEKNRRKESLWNCFLWATFFLILLSCFFLRYRRRLERGNERLCFLLKKGIPILQCGIEEESLEGMIQYEAEWVEFIEHQSVGKIHQTGELILQVLQLHYRYSEREQERKQQMQNFVENVAHQWKTPLARMTLSLELMTPENWQEKQENCLGEIEGLQPLVERLLNVARMKSGKVVFQSKPLELKMLLLDAGKKMKEWQRVSIARALVTKPAVIFADEPSGNLDGENAKNVAEILAKASEQYHQTILMVTHDQQMADYADRILCISDGVVE